MLIASFLLLLIEASKLLDLQLISLFIIMSISGAFGGYINFVRENPLPSREDLKYKNKLIFDYIIIGVAASLLVPLFFTMISSSLLEKAKELNESVFIFIGFCLIASICSRYFIDGIVDKMLKDLKKDNEDSKRSIESIKNEISIGEKRIISILSAQAKVENSEFQEALTILEDELKSDPDNHHALALQAYCLKRERRIIEAIQSISKALELCNYCQPKF